MHTAPAMVGVNTSGVATPSGLVVSVTAESVPAPVLDAPIEKRMVWLDLPCPDASAAVAVAVIVFTPTLTEVDGRVKVSVEPLISIGMLANCPPAVAVIVAVRLLKSESPLFKVAVAWPFASVFTVLALKLPLVAEKAMSTFGIRAFDASTTVAVSVAADKLSVTIELVDVPNAMVPVTVPGGGRGTVASVEMSLQDISDGSV